MVEGARLESAYTSKGYQEFESLTLRSFFISLTFVLIELTLRFRKIDLRDNFLDLRVIFLSLRSNCVSLEFYLCCLKSIANISRIWLNGHFINASFPSIESKLTVV